MKKRFSKELVAASSRPMVLSILAGGESYGYEILKQVKLLSGGELEWSDGMLYPVLHRLERDGMVAGRWLPRFLALSGVAALGLGIFMSLDQPLGFMGVRELFGVGYWTWATSLVCVAAALRLRARERASANLNGPARTEALESNRV